MKKRFLAWMLCLVLILAGCGRSGGFDNADGLGESAKGTTAQSAITETQGEVADLGGDEKTFGEDIEKTGA